MTIDHIINAAGVAAIAVLMAVVGPQMDEIAATQAEAESAARTQAERERFEQSARAMCGGENGSWRELPDGAVRCYLKNGKANGTAKVGT